MPLYCVEFQWNIETCNTQNNQQVKCNLFFLFFLFRQALFLNRKIIIFLIIMINIIQTINQLNFFLRFLFANSFTIVVAAT